MTSKGVIWQNFCLRSHSVSQKLLSLWKPFPDSHWRAVTLKIPPAAKLLGTGRSSRNRVKAHPQHRCCWTRIPPEQHRGLRHSSINLNLLCMAARSALTVHANKPLVCFDCFIWLALPQVRSGQMLVVPKDESLMSGKQRTRWECHWPAEVLPPFKFGMLPSSAFIIFKKQFCSNICSTTHYRLPVGLGQQIHFFPLSPWKITSPQHHGDHVQKAISEKK